MFCLVKVTSIKLVPLWRKCDKCLCRRCSTFEYIIYRLCQRGLLCKEMELAKKMIGFGKHYSVTQDLNLV